MYGRKTLLSIGSECEFKHVMTHALDTPLAFGMNRADPTEATT